MRNRLKPSCFHIFSRRAYTKTSLKKEAVLLPIRIFIDQGHNPQGVNAGAEGFGLRE